MESEWELPHYEAWLYTLKQLRRVRMAESAEGRQILIRYYTLVAVVGGSGFGQFNGKRYRLLKGGCFLLAPGSWMELEAIGRGGLAYDLIVLDIKEAALPYDGACSKGRMPVRPEPLPLPDRLNIGAMKTWLAMVEELHRHSDQSSRKERYEQHLRLQQLLYWLWNWNSPPEKHGSSAVIDMVIDLLHAQPEQTVAVKELAATANLGVRQFTQRFKDVTGLTPLDYIARLRMNKAKRELMTTSESLAVIAQRAGYPDVYYFSRRFKQVIGLSPRQYADETRRKLRVVALYYNGMAMQMGVTPVAANLTWWGGSVYLREQEQGIVNLGITPSLQEIADQKPDLILLNDHNKHLQDQLQKIAPTVFIPYDGHRSVYQEARIFGELFRNPLEAERFILRYQHKAADARRRLAAAGVYCEQMTAVIIRPDGRGSRFSVFGDNYGRGGWSVYRGLRLQAPPAVRDLVDSGVQIAQQLPLHLLSHYVAVADIVLIVNEGTGFREAIAHPAWRELTATGHRRVYELGKERISYFDPISIEAQLELLTRLLLGEEMSGDEEPLAT